MGKVVTFSLDSRSDRRGEHPIRLYVRSCDGHRFQSTVGYNVPSEKWDSDKQRAIVDMESDSATNCKGIPFSEINERIEAISKAFEALLSVPGAATKSALASALDRITSKSLDNAIPDHKDANVIGESIDGGNEESEQIASRTESSNIEDLAIIREFLSNFHDFASKDRRKGYVNVYRPERHNNPVRFWFNPPFGKTQTSHPITSGTIMMKGDGTIIVQEQRLHLLSWVHGKPDGNPGKKYELQKCLGPSLSNFVNSIMDYWDDVNSFRLEGLSFNDIASSFLIPGGRRRIGVEAFKNHTELKSVSIPDGIVVIGGSAFAGCVGLEEIHLPDSVIEIGDSAFKGCAGLKSVYFPNVVEIGQSAFEGCAGLTEIRIPDSVTSIGRSAFKGCTGLTEIHISDGVTKIGESAFAGCLSLKELSVPNGLDLSKSGLSGEVRIIVRNKN